MATILKYASGNQETVNWTYVDGNTLSPYYSTDLCAIIDDGSVTAIGYDGYGGYVSQGIFRQFANLRRVVFPGITRILCETFYGCSNLISAEFDNVESFKFVQGTAETEPPVYGGGYFANCTNLKYLRIPKITNFDMEVAGAYAIHTYNCFQGCSSLEYIDLRNSPDSGRVLTYFSDTGLPSDYDLIVDETYIDNWKSLNSSYAGHFYGIFRVTMFSLSGVSVSKFEQKYVTKQAVESAGPGIYAFEITYTTVSNCICADAFCTDGISGLTSLYYQSPYGISAYYSDCNNPFDNMLAYTDNRVFNIYAKYICADTEYDLQRLAPCWCKSDEQIDTVSVNLSIEYAEDYIGEKDRRGWTWQFPTLRHADMSENTSIPSCLGYSFMYGCWNLTSFNAPEVSSIGDNGLNCGMNSHHIQVLNFPSVKTVGKNAFGYNANTLSIILPLVESIGEKAFIDCYSLKNVYAPQLTSLGNHAFDDDCYYLESVTMPLLRNIGDYAFANCAQLTNIFAPDITTMNCYMAQNIGISAFYNCQNLTSINGRFVEYVGEGAFSGCSSMTDMNFPLLSTFENSQQTLSGCDLEDIWIPQVSSQNVYIPSNSDRWMERFCNYSPDFTIDNIPSDPDMVQLRGYNVNILADNSGLYWAGLSKDSCQVIGYEWAGDKWRYVKNGYTERTQYEPSPDPKEGWKDWMHLCLDPEAAPWLSATFLGNSNFREEYQWYISSDEFVNANDKHDYLPKYCGSVYD